MKTNDTSDDDSQLPVIEHGGCRDGVGGQVYEYVRGGVVDGAPQGGGSDVDSVGNDSFWIHFLQLSR